MKLITSELLAAGVTARWKANYADPNYILCDGRRAGQITKELGALGPHPKIEDINRIIGNKSWTTPSRCDECQAAAPAVVRLGQEPDVDSRTVRICRSCLQKALELLS